MIVNLYLFLDMVSLDLAGFYLSTPVVLSHHVTDLLSHIALRLLKIIEPYLVEQERMANAQLLMYGSKHLEQNFFFFNTKTARKWHIDCMGSHD